MYINGGVPVLSKLWQDKILSSGLSAKKGLIWNLTTIDKYSYVDSLYNTYRKYVETYGKYWDSSNPNDYIIGYIQQYSNEKDASVIRVFLDIVEKLVKADSIPDYIKQGVKNPTAMNQVSSGIKKTVSKIGELPAELVKPTLNSFTPVLLIGLAGLITYTYLQTNKRGVLQ